MNRSLGDGSPEPPWRPWPPEFPVPPGSPTPRPGPAEPSTHGRFDPRELSDRLLEQRTILAHGMLDQESVSNLCAQLLTLDAVAAQPIRLELHSVDAELPDALTLMGVLEVVRGSLSAYASGVLRGPAVGILAAADHRFAYPNTLLVLCEPRMQVDGVATEIAGQRAQADAMLAELTAVLAAATGRDSAQIHADIERQRLLSVEEAIEYGLVEGRAQRRGTGRDSV